MHVDGRAPFTANLEGGSRDICLERIGKTQIDRIESITTVATRVRRLLNIGINSPVGLVAAVANPSPIQIIHDIGEISIVPNDYLGRAIAPLVGYYNLLGRILVKTNLEIPLQLHISSIRIADIRQEHAGRRRAGAEDEAGADRESRGPDPEFSD